MRDPAEVLQRALGARYEIERELGSGGAATVYLARDLRHDRPVAIKVSRPDSSTPSVDEARFAREIKLLARLQHPNILPLHDSGHVEDVFFYVAPYVSGESLRERISRERQLPIADALRIAGEVADALDCAHRNGIVHRDVKPENILLSNGHAIVADFGVARVLNPARNVQLTQPGVGGPGTAAYMSPEQLLGEEEIDARADVYALGCVLFEMLTGAAPFGGKGGFARRFTEPPPRLRALRHDAPEPVDDIVAKAMARSPDDRYRNGGEFARSLSGLHDTSVVDARSRALEPAAPTAAEIPRAGAVSEAPAPRQHGSVSASHKRGRIAAYVALAGSLLLGAALFSSRPDGAADAGAPAAKSIAVLPFANLSPDTANEYFADGMTEELIGALAKVEGLRVTARTSSYAFKATETDVREVARRLGVGTVVEGSVRRAGDRLRVTAKLVDGRTGTSLWSDTYERPATDVFAVQDEVARAIVGALDVRLGAGVRSTLARRHTSDLEAYDLYLKGRFAWNQRTPSGLAQAREYFAEAIARDSTFALAYAGLGDVYAVLSQQSDPARYQPLAKAAAQKALALDSTLAEAHATLGAIAMSEYDWKAAERELLRAIALNSGYATAHHWYAVMLQRQGHVDQSRAPIARARALDPLSRVIGTTEAAAFYLAHDYDAASERLEEVLRFDANFAEAHRALARALAKKGLHDAALLHLRSAARIAGTSEHGDIGLVLGQAGRRREAERVLSGLRSRTEEGSVAAGEIALVHIGLGRADSALAWLGRAVDRKEGTVAYLKADPRFDPVRADPRFAGLLQRMGVAPR